MRLFQQADTILCRNLLTPSSGQKWQLYPEGEDSMCLWDIHICLSDYTVITPNTNTKTLNVLKNTIYYINF
jgi:hypothetical protein